MMRWKASIQIMFLENKGYEVKSLSNGFDAIDYVKENKWMLYCLMKVCLVLPVWKHCKNKRSKYADSYCSDHKK